MPLVNPFDHVVSEFRIPPNDMPSLSTPSQAPSYQSLRTFQKALNHNAMSIYSTQTPLGHLHLVITEEEYLQASDDVKFQVPTDPSITETTDDVATGNVTRSMFDLATSSNTDSTADTLQAIKAFELQHQTYLKYVATVVTLRNLILNSVNNKYINDLEDDLTGYAKVSPLQLMTHLWSAYGTVDDADHAANEEAMKKPWTPPEPIAPPEETKSSMIPSLSDGDIKTLKTPAYSTASVRNGARRNQKQNPGKTSRNTSSSPMMTTSSVIPPCHRH